MSPPSRTSFISCRARVACAGESASVGTVRVILARAGADMGADVEAAWVSNAARLPMPVPPMPGAGVAIADSAGAGVPRASQPDTGADGIGSARAGVGGGVIGGTLQPS